MQRRPIRFFAERHLLDGDLYLPDDLEPLERRPALITCSGYQGLKTIHPERFARAMVPHGYVCLAFDYRGFGASEGERGRLAPQDWVEDVRAAVSFIRSVPQVDPERVGLIGWALGGGVAIAEAADDPRVRAVAACNAIGDGERSTRLMHDDHSWQRLQEGLVRDRPARARTGRSEIVHPFSIVRLDGVTAGYVDDELYKAAGFGSGVTLESAELLLRFRPEAVVERIAPRPLLLLHGERNELHAPDESRRLHELAGDTSELVLLDGAGHTEWMFDDHPIFRGVVDRLAAFFGAGLGVQDHVSTATSGSGGS
jgi:pimeloyl-ACP methyl ester carboxylesterase